MDYALLYVEMNLCMFKVIQQLRKENCRFTYCYGQKIIQHYS